MSIYEFDYTSIENKPISMSEFQGKVLLIVNTASKCGFAPQYKGLEELHQKYGSKGFSVIGFPCGQFREQEFDSEAEIQEFCSIRYGVTFPLSQKVAVRDDTAIPLFQYLVSQKKFEGLGPGLKSKMLSVILKNKYKDSFNDDQIKWNFTKFLIDRSGRVISRYEPTVEPKTIAADIEKRLAQKSDCEV